MALQSMTTNRNTIWFFAIVIGLIFGVCFIFAGMRIVEVRPQEMPSFVITYLVLGLLIGVITGWFCSCIIRNIVKVISKDLNTKVGLKLEAFVSKRKGISAELDIFQQIFQMILSVLKRVLLISLKLEQASSDLDKTAQNSSHVIKEIVDGMNVVNEKAVNNASNLRETISSLENSFSLSKDISSKLITAKDDSQSVSEIASSTQGSVKEAVKKMLKIKELTDGSTSLVNDLNDRSKQIGTILTEIANIAEKTNLLALNAAIEAARAGEQGLGFAVVAEEVRKLARGSAESSKKINNLINDILQKTENAAEMMQNNTLQVNQGMTLVKNVESSLGNMVDTTSQLNNIISEISHSANKQSETSDVMYRKVNTISQITDDISERIELIANSALSKTVIVDQTSSSAKELRTLSDVFQNALVPFEFEVEGANKRSAIRTETRIPCKFKLLLSGELIEDNVADYQMRGLIINLSAGGCVVETNEVIEQGKYVNLAFQIGSSFIQGLQGRLVRLKKAVAAIDDNDDIVEEKSLRHCVVSFNNLSTEHEKLIVEYVINAQRQFEVNLGILD